MRDDRIPDGTPMPGPSALGAASAPVFEDLYSRYQADPGSVDRSWRLVFQLADELGNGASHGRADAWTPERMRSRGHLLAASNPLVERTGDAFARFSDAVRVASRDRRIMAALYERYCGALGVESAHIDDEAVLTWVHHAVETARGPDDDALRRVHLKLVEADLFESFLARKFPGKKRFGAEGAEALIPLLDRLLGNAAADGVREIVIGTMHRGRLNILANVLGKPLGDLLAEFKGVFPFTTEPACSADLAYHMGCRTVLPASGITVTLLPNPSHLEAIDTVVMGCVRALQDRLEPEQRGQVMGIVLHTDAAVAGQGIVSEMLQLSALEAFGVGGLIHIVVNNQLGFTTEPAEGRSSRYCTGAWKAIDSLILHANGEDADAVLGAADLASAFRTAQGRDCVIDLLCYRRNGHNEIDEPRFTQPQLYRDLDQRTGVRQALEARLTQARTISLDEIDALQTRYRSELDAAYAGLSSWHASSSGELWGSDAAPSRAPPALSGERIGMLLDHLASVPDSVRLESKLERLVRQRGERERGIVWAVAEALAFGSLLLDRIPVRLSGQDTVRGAFSHRHFALTDVENGRRHVSLQHLAPDQARFSVINSPLSEYGVLGFEYGYSLARTEGLTIWEAQFGDFANGAQIMIDQFIVSGEDKWRQRSGLVMLLPHGLEGQGPEHSSARIERFLQLAANGNVRIAIPTTPANYFHLLRRQAYDSDRKPLVIMSPKTLLRLPAAVSSPSDFSGGTGFRPVLSSTLSSEARPAAIDRMLLCCGKLAYDLEHERASRGAHQVAIVRLDQLYPLPATELGELLRQYADAELVWVQEEPANAGAWPWLDRRLEQLAQAYAHHHPRVRYCGRPESASPAGSFHGDHAADQAAIVGAAFE